jgi:hypothetical protein
MKLTLKIDIAASFSVEPKGRYLSDGNESGEAFRKRVLIPALAEAETVQVVLDGTEGYGSSFLDEAFAGLLREHGFTAQGFNNRIHLVSEDDPSFVDEVNGYVEDEERRQVAKRASDRQRSE